LFSFFNTVDGNRAIVRHFSVITPSHIVAASTNRRNKAFDFSFATRYFHIMKRAASSGAPSPAPGAKRKKNEKGFTRGYPDALRTTTEEKEYDENGAPPPIKATIYAATKPLPTRNAATKELVFPDYPEFKPNLTPSEVILLGSFGGTYFRTIHSAVCKGVLDGKQVSAEFSKIENWGWKDGKAISLPAGVGSTPCVNKVRGKFDSAIMLHSGEYRTEVNRFGVKCGGSLFQWEGKGWINEIDPYGWFHWYCRFYLGRRTSDDKRQVQRWLNSAGPKGRFRNQLLNKCTQANKPKTDVSVSPVIRQTLLHWGLEVK